MKTINELTPLNLADVGSPDLLEFAVDNASVNPKTSNKMTLRQISGFVYDIWPTGVAATDTPAFESLLRALPIGTGGTVRVMDNGSSLVLDPQYSVAGTSGNVKVDGNYLGAIEINKPFRLIGENRNARIELRPINTVIGGYRIIWGDSSNWFLSTSKVGIDPAPAGSVAVTGWPTGHLKRGDWILVFSSDAIPNVAPHYSSSGGIQQPGELRRVAYVATINEIDYAFLDGALIDDIVTNPYIVKLPMLRNCGVANLTIGSNRNLATETSFENGTSILLALDVQRTVGFRVEDVTIDDTTAGALRINTSADVVIEGFNGYGVPDNSIDYGLIAMTVNGLTFRDSTWHNARHVFTTGGNQMTTTINRIGTPVNVFVHNVTQYQAGSRNADILTGFDTHAEGYGVTFDSCRVFAGGTTTTRQHGFGGRSRNMVFRNCSFVDSRKAISGRPNEGYAFVISSHNATIEGGRIEGAAIGVQMRSYNVDSQGATIYQHEARISNVQFDNVWGCPVLCDFPINGIQVDNCCIKESATWYSGTGESGLPQFTRSAVSLYAGTGHKIRGNFFDRESNDYVVNPYSLGPSAIQIVGNHCYGYTQRFTQGTDKIGIRGDHGDPNGVSATGAQSLQATFEHHNYTS